MKNQIVILGGREIAVQELTFAQLKRLLPAINRVAYSMSRNNLDEAAMVDMGFVLCAGTGLPQDEIDSLPIKASELAPAFEIIVELAGLGPKEGAQQGEVVVASDGTGTSFTPTSPPASDGPGETSIS